VNFAGEGINRAESDETDDGGNAGDAVYQHSQAVALLTPFDVPHPTMAGGGYTYTAQLSQ
jgi:hypothetical protein